MYIQSGFSWDRVRAQADATRWGCSSSSAELKRPGPLKVLQWLRAEALAFLGTGAVVLKHEEEEENVNRPGLAAIQKLRCAREESSQPNQDFKRPSQFQRAVQRRKTSY